MLNSMSKFGLRRFAGATAIVSILALSACDESLMMMPGAIDPNDTCSQFQQGIVTAREEANALRVQNVIAGAAAGAIVGALLAGPDNREQGAIFGAFLGGAAAGAATEQSQLSQREADAALLRDVNAKAGSANQLLTKAGRSAASLRNCRQGQIRDLERAVRGNRISNEEARAQLRVLQRRANADNQIISASFNGIGNRVDNFARTGAQASGVEAAILTRESAARTQAQRSARAATTNVARAKSTQATLVNADARRSQRIDRSLDAIDVLLEG